MDAATYALAKKYVHGIAQQASRQNVLLKTTTARAVNSKFVPSVQPFYFGDNDALRGKYITRIGFFVMEAPSVMSLVFKNVEEAANVAVNDFTIDGVYCTIASATTGWHEYDLTQPHDDIIYDNLTNGKIYIPPSGRIIGFGQKNEACNTGYNTNNTPADNPDMAFYRVYSGDVSTNATFVFDIWTTEDVSEKGFYHGKNLSILGDSISTYVGYIPEGNSNFYTGSNCNVTGVNQTWWKRVMDTLGMTLVINNSWSGSRVSGAGASAGCMERATALHTGLASPDVIVVYMGINDFNGGVGLGAYDGTQAFPTDTSTFREAYAVMLSKIMTRYKVARVFVCTLPYCERTGSAVFPEANSNAVLLAQWNAAIRDIADLFGVGVLDMAKCGLTYQNLNLFTGDWAHTSGQGLHPNANGHRLMANKVIEDLTPPLKHSVI